VYTNGPDGTTRDATRPQAGDDLPDGDGKKILLASCTACHDLTEVTKFKGFYTRDDWTDIVKTMIEYGASVKDRGRAGAGRLPDEEPRQEIRAVAP
jgi:cytochrome c5